MTANTGHSELASSLGDILLIFAIAGVMIPLLQRFRVSSVLGYLVMGVVIGPHVLGHWAGAYPWMEIAAITDTALISSVAELGIIFLLFMIGLELSFSRLWSMRRHVLGLGSAQILVTGIVIAAIAWQFGNGIEKSILIGGAFSLSSTAIVIQLLDERHMMSKPVGLLSFSVLLMQDLAVVPMLVILGIFSGAGDGNVALLLFEALALAAAVIAAIIITGRVVIRPALKLLSPARNTEWLMACVFLLVGGIALLTHEAGLSAALGAFLAGLLIAETEYRHEVESIIEPVKGLMMGVFFLSIGLIIDIGAVMENPLWLGMSVLGILVLKTALFYPLARAFAVPPQRAARAAIMLAQCGEFAFLIIALAMQGGMIASEDAQFFLLVAALSMLVTPMTTRLADPAGRMLAGRAARQAGAAPEEGDTAGLRDHVIIAGFGRVGRIVAAMLEDRQIPYVALDRDGARVGELHSRGYPVYYGNGRRGDLWCRLRADTARAAVITVDDQAAIGAMMHTIRSDYPLLPVLVRTRYSEDIDHLRDAGASAVVPETFEAALELGRHALTQAGLDDDALEAAEDRVRRRFLGIGVHAVA